MIDKLLASAEAEQRVGATTLNTVDVAAMAREVAADFLTTGRKPIVHAPESCVAVGDPKSLSRVFVNLVDNAFRHGAAPVDIFVEERDGRVILAVEDTGPGIAPEHRARIFDRFFRVDPNRTRSGMGLGLSIVHSLVEGSGGTIAVEESQHGGARFVVTLEPAPAVGVPKSAAPSDADPLAQRG
jgi:signal transduction histidine kinase